MCPPDPIGSKDGGTYSIVRIAVRIMQRAIGENADGVELGSFVANPVVSGTRGGPLPTALRSC
jgi:hypothetical protein